jgi:hypothetical protein
MHTRVGIVAVQMQETGDKALSFSGGQTVWANLSQGQDQCLTDGNFGFAR